MPETHEKKPTYCGLQNIGFWCLPWRLGSNRTEVEWTGFEPTPENTGKTVVSEQSGAECGAHAAREAPLDPELAAVVDVWLALPKAIKTGILAMIRGTK